MPNRRYLPAHRTHAIVRRTSERRFFLAADPFVRDLFFYLLGYQQQKHLSILLHAFCALGTHYHKNLTDSHDEHEVSDLSNYMRDFNSLAARSINVHRGRGENLWRAGRYNNVMTQGLSAIERQWVYVATQAVRAGLVRWPEDYPGPWTSPEDFGTTRRYHRPKGSLFGGFRKPLQERNEGDADPAEGDDLFGYQELLDLEDAALSLLGGTDVQLPDDLKADVVKLLRGARPDSKPGKRRKKPRNKKRAAQIDLERARREAKEEAKGTRKPSARTILPDHVDLTIYPPPGFEHLGLEGTRRHFRELLDNEVRLIHAQRKAEGRDRYLGAKRILKQDPFASAGSVWPTFKRNPRIAASDTLTRLKMILTRQGFNDDHGVATKAWRRLNRDVVFPAGAVGMVLDHNVRFRGGPKDAQERKRHHPPLPKRRRRSESLPPRTEPPGHPARG